MTDATAEEETEPQKSSKMPLIIGLVLALVGGGGGFFAVSQGLILAPESAPEKAAEKEAHENSVFVAKYSPSGQYIVSGGRDAQLRVWEIEEFREVNCQPAHWYTINDLVFHPKGHWLATASRDKTIKIWDTNTFQLLKVIDVQKFGGHINSVNKLHWSSHNDWLISCSDDRTIMVWAVSG